MKKYRLIWVSRFIAVVEANNKLEATEKALQKPQEEMLDLPIWLEIKRAA